MQFPAPQYLGAKYRLRQWIADSLPAAGTVLDAFAGSQSIAYELKQRGLQVITNDFLTCSALVGMALIENDREILDADDLRLLFAPNACPSRYNLMERLYAGLFFTKDEARFLDSVRSRVEELDNRYKRALALTVLCRALTRKVTMGHFAHTRALVYAQDPQRLKRNPSLGRPLKELFLELLPSYNAAVFKGRQPCRSLHGEVREILRKLISAPGSCADTACAPLKLDAVYFDPPYCGSHADYQSFYHLLETYCEYWSERDGLSFVNSIRRYEPKRVSGFDAKTDLRQSLTELFAAAAPIPLWLLSYNDRSYPSLEELISLLQSCAPERQLKVQRREYAQSRGGRGSVKGSAELLISAAL